MQIHRGSWWVRKKWKSNEGERENKVRDDDGVVWPHIKSGKEHRAKEGVSTQSDSEEYDNDK